MKTYTPTPINTDNIELPKALNELTEQMARNVHDVWAKARLNEGWHYGEQRDDQHKTHPGLVSYDELSESEREYDRKTAIQTLKLILKLGFKISKSHVELNEFGILDRIKHIYHGFYWTMGGTIIMAILIIAALITAPHFEYNSWLILTAITIIGICALCWLGYYCKHLLKIYSDSRKEVFETELSLYREAVRREELILNEQTNNELQNLKIEIKRKELEIQQLNKKIKEIK